MSEIIEEASLRLYKPRFNIAIDEFMIGFKS